jgi:hypothetical protein
MTTFESILLLAVTAYVIITAFGVLVIKKILKEIIDKQYANWEQLRKIETHGDASASAIIELKDAVNMMHKNLCVEIADKMVNKMYPVNEGESLDAPFEPDYKLKKDIENKLNGFAAAVLDAECCPKEILDLWAERICGSAHKFIKQFKIDWDKLSKEQQDEFLKRLIMPNYDKPFVPPFNPTCETTNKEG